MRERNIKVLEILSTNKKINVTLLAEMLDVSMVTLRKDLDILERRGIVKRTHGYVSLEGADYTGKRIAINHKIKRRIAKAAAETVEEGEIIILESGSCCAMLAEELALAKKNVNIVTNSIFISNYIRKLKGVKIILLGGYLQPESQILVGPMTKKCVEQIYAQKLFLGTDGFVPEYGFTGRDHLRVETAIEFTNRAETVYMLTESEKFNRRGAYNLISLDKLTGVFTDDRIPKEAETVLRKNNVKVHKVPSAEEKIKWQKLPGMPPFLYKEKEF